jgi:hypothetical protein
MDRLKSENASKVDVIGGTGPYAVIRRCRRWHIKGEHYNHYRHVVFAQFDTLEEAQEDAQKECPGHGFMRKTDCGADCKLSLHTIQHVRLEKGAWRNTLVPRNFLDEREQEQERFGRGRRTVRRKGVAQPA